MLSLRRRLSAVLCGGFCGTITRYWLSQWVQVHLGKGWPYDIFLINITGALLLAFITTLADATFFIGPTRRLFINVGFLGAYTTFSSFALGNVQLATAGHWFAALSYLFMSLAVGILAVWSGDALGQWVINWRAALAPTQSLPYRYDLFYTHKLKKDHIDRRDGLLLDDQNDQHKVR
jgi:fluoride exporter